MGESNKTTGVVNTYVLSDCGKYYNVTFRNSDRVGYIDKEDYELVRKHNWGVATDPVNDVSYAYTNIVVDEDNYIRKTIQAHTFIMERLVDNINIIDHINGNGLDNRKSNLRARTQSENNMNKRVQRNNTTGFAGISWHKKQRMWNTHISVRGERIFLGSYYYMRNALRARISAEEEYFGEHSFYSRDCKYRDKVDSILNLPEKTEPVILPHRVSNTGIRGIHWSEDRKRYLTSFKKTQIRFKTIEEAIAWRKDKEREHWGDAEVITSREKEDRLV